MRALARYFAMGFLCAVLAGCRAQAIYNVDGAIVAAGPTRQLSLAEVGKVMTDTAIRDGWVVDAATPGVLYCTIRWGGGHQARIEIPYSGQTYAIRYVSSENLLAGPDRIHRNYNRRIQKLHNDIDLALSAAVNR